MKKQTKKNDSDTMEVAQIPPTVLVEFFSKSGVDDARQTYLQEMFTPLFTQAEELAMHSKGLVITDESQTDLMELARESRLELKRIRVAGEKLHAEIKRPVLDEAKAIDGVWNILKDIVKGAEDHLFNQEKFIEIQRHNRMLELANDRRKRLLPFEGHLTISMTDEQLSGFTEVEFIDFIQDQILLVEAKKARAEREEKERIERERQREEERLKLLEENKRQSAELAAQREAQRIEMERVHNENRARLEAEKAKAEAERLKADLEKIRQDDVIKKQREELNARIKADLERQAEEDRIASGPVLERIRAYGNIILSTPTPDMKGIRKSKSFDPVEVGKLLVLILGASEKLSNYGK